MPSQWLLDAQSLPDSPFAAELHSGLRKLRFSPTLEPSFVRAHLARVQLRVCIWQSVITLVSAFFSISRVVQLGWLHPISLLHIGLIMPLQLWVTWATFSSRYEVLYLPSARFVVPLIGAVSATFGAWDVSLGHPEELAVLSAQITCIFLLSGLLFRAALLAGATLLLAYVVSAIEFGIPRGMSIEFTIFLIINGATAAAALWGMEYTDRKTYLKEGLIADLAARDPLTGLMNRRAFDDHLQRLWNQGVRDAKPLAVVMFDVDHFKSFNDRNGHQAGDDLLRRVALCAQNVARQSLDLAARYGGDEFVLLLDELAPAQARDVAEKLRQAVEELRIQHRKGFPTAYVSVTLGVAVVRPTRDRTPSGALQLADKALYDAKQAGRNCVRLLGQEEYDFLETGVFNAADVRRNG